MAIVNPWLETTTHHDLKDDLTRCTEETRQLLRGSLNPYTLFSGGQMISPLYTWGLF